MLLGEQTLSEAQLAALDRLGNRNGRYDIGDLLSWRARCGRDEVRCGGPASATGAGSLPASPAMPPTKRQWPNPAPEEARRPCRAALRPKQGRKCRNAFHSNARCARVRPDAGPAGGVRPSAARPVGSGPWLWVLLPAPGAAASGIDVVQPAQPDPGPLHVRLTVPPEARDIGAMLVVEGPGIDSLSAPGFELIQADAASSNRREAIIAGSLSTGPVLQVWVPDRRQLGDYRVTVDAGGGRRLRAQGSYAVRHRDLAVTRLDGQVAAP